MEVEQTEREINRGEAEAVNDEQKGKLRRGDMAGVGAGPDPRRIQAVAQAKKELERINVKENEEEQDAGEKTGDAIVQAVTAAEFVMHVPDQGEEEKANGEGGKTAHGVERW